MEENKTIEENYHLEDDMDDNILKFQDPKRPLSRNETRSLTSKISDAFKNFF